MQAALAKERISAWSGECRHVDVVKQQQGDTGSDSDLKANLRV